MFVNEISRQEIRKFDTDQLFRSVHISIPSYKNAFLALFCKQLWKALTELMVLLTISTRPAFLNQFSVCYSRLCFLKIASEKNQGFDGKLIAEILQGFLLGSPKFS